MSIETLHTIAEARARVLQWQREGLKVALTPTMGNLHSGHASLVQLGLQHADRVIASVFVNPTQFGPNEDFDRYPRTLKADEDLLASVGCHAVFAPSAVEMYPDFASGKTNTLLIEPGPIAAELCGEFRPGHFAGVATVVAKLFNIMPADVAVFGEKDFQQLFVIRQLVRELNFPIKIIGAPTVREANGLAKSSRNQYLSAEEREQAGLIYQCLQSMREHCQAGRASSEIESTVHARLSERGFKPDYATVRDAHSLASLQAGSTHAVALIAARLGRARLIDNLSFALHA
jgi:pantoate--beta-alanine ligase